MEVEIILKKENPLLNRSEVRFRISHPKEKVPTRKSVRDELAGLLNTSKDKVVIDNMKAEFGKPGTIGYAKIYNKSEDALEVEGKAILKRNDMLLKHKPKEEGSEEKKDKEEK
jgi:small subunit ribosomal protein S24e